jgi:hypothetical protein
MLDRHPYGRALGTSLRAYGRELLVLRRRSRSLTVLLSTLLLVAATLILVPGSASAAGETQLEFTLQPTSATAGDGNVTVEVSVEDSGGDPVPGNTDSITLTLNTGTIDAGATASAADGVAEFTLSIHTAGIYTLTATDDTTTLPTMDSTSFTISAGAATHLVYTAGPPTTAQATGSFGATVQARDQYENPVTGETISISPDDAANSPVVTSGNGEAVFTGLEIHTTGPNTVVAHDPTVGVSDASSPITITPGPPHHLTITTQPANAYSARPSDPSTSQWTVGLTAEVRDVYDNLVDTNTDPISVALDGGSFSAGTTTTSAVGGVGTFSGLKVLTPGNYTITASDAAIPSTVTSDSDSLTSGNQPFVILPHADLQIVMDSDHKDVAGLDQTYSVTVHNFGPNANSSYTVKAPLPSGITQLGTGTDAACGIVASDVVCTRTVGINDGAQDQFAIALKVPASYANGGNTPLSFTATLDSTTPTQQPGDSVPNSAPVTDTVHAEADLGVSLAATPSNTPLIAGRDSVSYAISVTNGGPSDNVGYSVTLQVPAHTSVHGSLPSACSGSGPVTCSSAGPLVPETSPGTPANVYTVVLDIDHAFANAAPNAGVSLDPAATLTPSAPSNEGSPATPKPNTAHDAKNVFAQADLGIAVSSFQTGPTTYSGHQAVAGTNQTFEVVVTNYQYSDNLGFQATVTVPSGLTVVNAGGCSGSVPTFTCASTDTITPANTKTFDIVLSIPADYTNPNPSRTVQYSAALVNGSLTPSDQGGGQGTHADSTGSQNLQVDAVADVSDVGVTQTASVEAADGFVGALGFDANAPGNRNTVLYQVTVSNTAGPSDAYGVTLKEDLSGTSHLDLSTIKKCVVTLTINCTSSGSFSAYTNNDPIALGRISLATMTNDTKRVVFFRVRVTGTDRRSGASTYPTNDAVARVATDSSDPNSTNDHSEKNISVYTVPDAPTLIQVQPGDRQIAAQWTDNADGGNGITGYNLITQVGAAAPVAYFLPSSSSSLSGGIRSAIFPSTQTLTNGTLYKVWLEARNQAGDSSRSADPGPNPFSAQPCGSCVISQFTNARTFLLSSNGTDRVITAGDPQFGSWFNPGNGCFPKSNDTTQPGATTADTKVSCMDIPAGTSTAKIGALMALHDETSVAGDCPNPDGNHPCLGNQTVVAIPPGTGSAATISETLIYDKTISTDKYGSPCTAAPCGKKYTYIVYFRPSASVPAIAIGSSIPGGATVGSVNFPKWCPTVGGNPVIPTGQTACVVNYVITQGISNPNPFPNGNVSNGSQGNGDMRLTILFKGDPRTAP